MACGLITATADPREGAKREPAVYHLLEIVG